VTVHGFVLDKTAYLKMLDVTMRGFKPLIAFPVRAKSVIVGISLPDWALARDR
jgi:hypothetical protein